jgi:hypothetical protein
VYSLDWDGNRKRARLSTWNPGFYFPVLDPMASPDDFPETVHIAYQFDDDDGKVWVRRISWRLGPILPQIDPATGSVSATGKLPHPLADAAAVTLGKQIVILGGAGAAASSAVLSLSP